MLVTVWIDDDNRVTRDADFLGHGDADPDKLVADFRAIMQIDGADGLVFDVDALAATVIREEMEYGGVRLRTAAYLERTRIPVTIDIGFGDAMADTTRQLEYPTLLDLPVPHVRSYPPATVVAEKFQAMVAFGDELDAAIRATFERRKTAIPTDRPPGLSAEMTGDEAKQRQWRAYAASIELEALALEAVVNAIWNLVGPSCARLTAK